jgi:hypothetical protein
LCACAQLAFAKEPGVLYISLPSETEAGSAGEQPARDSWVTVMEPSSRRELDTIVFPLFIAYFIIVSCLRKRKSQPRAQLSDSFRNLP